MAKVTVTPEGMLWEGLWVAGWMREEKIHRDGFDLSFILVFLAGSHLELVLPNALFRVFCPVPLACLDFCRTLF